MHAKLHLDGSAAQKGVTGQKNAVFMALGRNQTETVVGRQSGVLPFQCKDIAYPLRRRIEGFHSAVIEEPPFPTREVEQFKLADWERNYKSIG